MIVLDASALLALVQREPGADKVADTLPEAVMSTANLAEVLSKAGDRGFEIDHQSALLASLGIRYEPVTTDDARAAAHLRQRDDNRPPVLSLGDRLCLALAARFGAPVLTADRAWTSVDHDVEIQLLR